HSFDPGNSLYVQAYTYYFHLDDRYDATLPQQPAGPLMPIDGGSAARRTDLEVQQNFSVGPNLRWVWGGSVREDTTEVPLLFSDTRYLHVQRLFGHAEWRIDDAMLLNTGAMVEHNSLTGTDVAPQLALNWRFDPDQTLRFSMSRALRTPTVIENQ